MDIAFIQTPHSFISLSHLFICHSWPNYFKLSLLPDHNGVMSPLMTLYFFPVYLQISPNAMPICDD